jgi:hypothetical protein
MVSTLLGNPHEAAAIRPSRPGGRLTTTDNPIIESRTPRVTSMLIESSEHLLALGEELLHQRPIPACGVGSVEPRDDRLEQVDQAVVVLD